MRPQEVPTKPRDGLESAWRVASRYLEAKGVRTPIRVTKGWHVTPTQNVGKMLGGIKPVSRGMPDYGEESKDKTYFFRDFDSAAHYLFSLMEDNGDPMAREDGPRFRSVWNFKSPKATDYRWCILEFKLQGLTSFADQEEPVGNGFTTDFITGARVSLVPVAKWLPVVKRFIRKYKLPLSQSSV